MYGITCGGGGSGTPRAGGRPSRRNCHTRTARWRAASCCSSLAFGSSSAALSAEWTMKLTAATTSSGRLPESAP